MVVTPPAQRSRQIPRAIIPFAIAAVAGVIHGIFSVYWGFGGNWLLETIGARLVNAFEGRRGLLLIVAAVKLGFAVVPLAWTLRGWPRHWIWRIGCELGALSLIVWGGANTVVGHLVLAGVIRPDDGYDRAAMIGHGWLWDPLFVLWGVALLVGLLRLRRPRSI
ncbi:DUF3995 domain-containing protein [Enemella evansiae]|uniref:DUF3995 domain-containing protein n=1 Tax=Enemella evansiae TaxID=2016499 RepID=UPI001E3AEDDF|nr:DUF3995 domain-containing protein [Enemella evansiae]